MIQTDEAMRAMASKLLTMGIRSCAALEELKAALAAERGVRERRLSRREVGAIRRLLHRKLTSTTMNGDAVEIGDMGIDWYTASFLCAEHLAVETAIGGGAGPDVRAELPALRLPRLEDLVSNGGMVVLDRREDWVG
jgi:hypothetical protein